LAHLGRALLRPCEERGRQPQTARLVRFAGQPERIVYYTYLRLITNHDFASFTFGDGSVGKYSSLGAPVASDLTWETAQQWDLGLDVSMLGNRFNLTADIYMRDTKDMLPKVSHCPASTEPIRPT